MATLTPQFFQLLEADVKDIFFKGFSMQPLKYPRLFSSKTSTKAYEDRLRIAALGTFATKPEGTPIAFDDPVQGTQVRTVHQTFALGWRASMEMMEDDQHDIMSKMSADLGESARDHQERLAWALINAGYTGTGGATGLEGETLFSSTHTLLKTGGTATNIVSPPIALSVTGIESMLNLASTTTSDEGRFVEMSPSILLIHPNEQHNAYVLLETQFRPGSSDNDRNTVVSTRSGLTPLEVPYLSSTTNWSVHAGSGRNSLQWNNRKMPTFSRAQDADTLDQKFYGVYRASVMFSEWRGNWGSQA
jgi:phage major head subunit gpT-like protein